MPTCEGFYSLHIKSSFRCAGVKHTPVIKASGLKVSHYSSIKKFLSVSAEQKAGHVAAYTYSSLSFFSYVFLFSVGQHLIPNKHLFVSFLSFFPSISHYLYADPLHCNMTYLLLRLLKDDLKEYTYAARLAGLVYGVASGMNAILVSKPFEVWREDGVPVKAAL